MMAPTWTFTACWQEIAPQCEAHQILQNMLRSRWWRNFTQYENRINTSITTELRLNPAACRNKKNKIFLMINSCPGKPRWNVGLWESLSVIRKYCFLMSLHNVNVFWPQVSQARRAPPLIPQISNYFNYYVYYQEMLKKKKTQMHSNCKPQEDIMILTTYNQLEKI